MGSSDEEKRESGVDDLLKEYIKEIRHERSKRGSPGMAQGSHSAPPPTEGQGWGWVRDELKEKASKDYVEGQIKALEALIQAVNKEGEETKKIALSGRNKAMEPHQCARNKTVDNLVFDSEKRNTRVRGIIVTVISAIVITAGTLTGWLYSHKVLRDDVDDLKTDVAGLQGGMTKVVKSQEAMQEALEQDAAAEKLQQKQQMEDFRDALKEVLLEVKEEDSSNRRRRSR